MVQASRAGGFVPVTLTLETQAEVDAVYGAVSTSLNKDYDSVYPDDHDRAEAAMDASFSIITAIEGTGAANLL